MREKDLLNRAVDSMKGVPIDEIEAERSAERVLARLHRIAAAPEAEEPPRVLEGCADFLKIVPAYIREELTPARRLLLEDHTRGCIPCRAALRAAREGRVEARAPLAPPRRERSWAAPALAAAVGGLMLLVGWGFWTGVLLPRSPQMAQVQGIEGGLARVSAEGVQALHPGDWVAEGEEVRTPVGGRALLELADGSRIELDQRSRLRVSSRRSHTTVRVEQGRILVEAAEQGRGELSVATDDCLVSVKGTVFSVSQGAKGSRVAVVEGEVQVRQGRERRVLYAGEQFASNTRLAAVPVESSVAWSQDSQRYFALLGEMRLLRAELSQVALAAEPNYSTRLLELVPAATVAYLALPNPGAALEEIERIWSERLADSEVLREWWEERVGAGDDHAWSVVERVRSLSAHLGSEIVVAAEAEEVGEVAIVVLAEVGNPSALLEDLERAMEDLERATAGGNNSVRILVDPFEEAGDGEAFFWVSDDLLVAAPSVDSIRKVATAVAEGSDFVQTELYRDLAVAYAEGSELLAGLELDSFWDRIAGEPDGEGEISRDAVLEWSGLGDAQRVIARSRSRENKTQTEALLSFAGERRGVAAWLAEPAPMGALDFVSAEATLATAMVVMDPLDIADELFDMLSRVDPRFTAELERLEDELGIDLRQDLAGPLGGEMAFALDGPLFPDPSWKLVVEVYDPVRLQQTLEWVVEKADQLAIAEGEPSIHLTSSERGGRQYYSLERDGGPVRAVYSFVDGYLLVAPSVALIERSLQTRSSEYTLLSSAAFRDLLPVNAHLDFSALHFQNVGSLVEPVARLLSEASNLDAEERSLIEELVAETEPSLFCAYGEPEGVRFVAMTHGSLLGSALERLFAVGQLGSLSHLLAAGAPPGRV